MSNNIVLSDEIVYVFGRKRMPRKCCMGVDLKKAFDAI